MFNVWFIHRCTIERNQSDVDDDYRSTTQDWRPVASATPCRMKITQVRNPLPDLGEGPMIPRYQCFVGPGVDVRDGDRVVSVVDEEGNDIEGVFKVEARLARRAMAVRHITLELSRVR